ncbi:MAG: hypothetical protein PVH80_10720 [Anaerolineae bacterium]|jgi:hypothetical protein
MKEVDVNGELVIAGPGGPDKAICPDCGTEVKKRHVTRIDGTVTHFYRRMLGQGKGCSRRYRPTSGAQVLGIAFAMSECHQKLLTVLLPSVDIGQDDLQ